jgi:hypothetical protein
MVAPLPTGVSTQEVSDIFAALNAAAIIEQQKFSDDRMPNYLSPYVNQGAPIPPGVSTTEVNEILGKISTEANNHRYNYIVKHTPSYLTASIPDYVTPPNSETAAWAAAVQVKGATVSAAQQVYVDTLITSLKLAGVWPLLDRLFLFACENATQAVVDIVKAASATAVNSPTFTAGRGFTGNGTSSYVDSNFKASVGSNNFTVNNACMGAWILSATGSSGHFVANDNGAYSRFYSNGVVRELEINQNSSAGTYTPGSPTGFAHGQRTTSAAYAAYGSGGNQGFSSTIASSGALTPFNHIFFASPNSSGIGSFSGHQLSLGWIGASLTQVQINSFYAALQAYMATQGVDEAFMWQQTVLGKGGTVSAGQLTNIRNLVTSLKSIGVWGSLDRLWPLAAENAIQALVDIVVGATATAVNSPVFTANRGYKGDGVAAYVNTNFTAANVPGAKFSQNDASAGVMIMTADPVFNCVIGDNNSSYGRILTAASGVREVNVNTQSALGSYTPAGYLGVIHGERTGATAQAAYQNGFLEHADAAVSVALSNQPHLVLANISGSGTIGQWSAAQIGMAWVGKSLGAAGAAAFTKAIRQYFVGIGYDEVAQYTDAVVNLGGTVSAGRQTTLRTLVAQLKSSNVWPLLDRLWLYAVENLQSALIDLVGCGNSTAVNSPTFTANLGFTGNGTSSYVLTGFNLGNANGNFLQNTASFGCWIVTARTGASSAIDMGSSGGAHCQFAPKYADGNLYGDVNSSVQSTVVPPASVQGFWHLGRSNATRTSVFRNGSVFASYAQASIGVPNQPFAIGAYNSSGSFSNFSTDQIAGAFVGGDLAGKELPFYSALRAYMTTVGVP